MDGNAERNERDATEIAAEARELFGRWEAEERAGYRGKVSWEQLKRDLAAERPERG